MPGEPASPDGSRLASTGHLGHTSPARLVFMTGLVFSLLLTLIAFLDHKPTRMAIFGFLSFAFFLMLLRTPRARTAPWSTRIGHEEGKTVANGE